MSAPETARPSPPRVLWMIWGEWRDEMYEEHQRTDVSVFETEADAIEAAMHNVGGESIDDTGGRCRVYRLTVDYVGEAYIEGPQYRAGEKPGA